MIVGKAEVMNYCLTCKFFFSVIGRQFKLKTRWITGKDRKGNNDFGDLPPM